MGMAAILRAIAPLSLAGALGCNSVTLVAVDGGQDGGDAGAPGEAGSGDAAACAEASVKFVLTAAAGSATGYCLGAPGNCSGEWLSIRAADGGDLSLVAGCIAQCGPCMAVACPNICAVPTLLGANGATQTWDGTTYPHGTCGAGLSCYDESCAPPGSYIATMCGYATAGADASTAPGCSSGATTPTCTDVPFDWPPASGTATVQGTIGGDGG